MKIFIKIKIGKQIEGLKVNKDLIVEHMMKTITQAPDHQKPISKNRPSPGSQQKVYPKGMQRFRMRFAKLCQKPLSKLVNVRRLLL